MSGELYRDEGIVLRTYKLAESDRIVVMRDGVMQNATLTNYIIPTTVDTPQIHATILENPYPGGPFGAKGVGEMPMDGPASAVVNALRGLGLDLAEIPATPEILFQLAHREAAAQKGAA